jgi:hypothetical protein
MANSSFVKNFGGRDRGTCDGRSRRKLNQLAPRQIVLIRH